MENGTLFFKLCLIFAYVLVSALCAEINNPVVRTHTGKLQGKTITNSKYNVKYQAFKGIPFAEPPVGSLRFQAPVPKKPWKGVRTAFEHGSICANRWGFFLVRNTAGGSEDCLFLNVYTPNINGKLPVMFWIHGGAFMSGSGNTDLYGPEHLIKKNVVVVTVNYRYSAFGFLSTNDENAPGNAGMKDVVLALKWVQRNIKKFGGDRKKVTIFGHSAGSVAADYLMVADNTEGLFQQAILQSGTSLMDCLFQPNPKEQAEMLALKLNINFTDTKDLIQKLQAVPYQDIVDVETFLFSMPYPFGLRAFEFAPCVEPENTPNAFLTETPLKRMMDKNYHKIPIMVGGPDTEGLFFESLFYIDPTMLSKFSEDPYVLIPLSFELARDSANTADAINSLRQIYFGGNQNGTIRQWLNVYSDGVFTYTNYRTTRFRAEDPENVVYLYEFKYDNGNLNFFKIHLNLIHFDGTCHADELFYEFEPYEDEFQAYVADSTDLLVRERLTTMWTNFAKYGNPTPNVDGTVITAKWDKYEKSQDNYYELGPNAGNRQHVRRMNDMIDLQLKYAGHY